MTILVTGATGTVGREVMAQLAGGGEAVRALTRDPGRAAVPAGVEVACGDLGRPETLGAAFAGVDRVFLLTSAGPETPWHDGNAVQAAERAGVRHVVKLSVIWCEYDQHNLVTAWHQVGEEALRLSGLAWTFLRPGAYMSNARLWAATIKSQGAVYAAHTRTAASVIDPRDIAAVAVAALTSPGHEGRTYRITGPEALSTADQVERLGALLGRPLRLVEVPAADYIEALASRGASGLAVRAAMTNLGDTRLDETRRLVLPVVEEVTGRRPHTFDEWAARNRGAFQPPSD